MKKTIDHILFEAVDEVIKKFGKKPSSSFGTNGNNKGGQIQIGICKTEVAHSRVTGKDKEFINVEITHVWKDGAQRLIDAINAVVPKNVFIATPANQEGKIFLKVNIDMKNEIPNYITKICDAIKQLKEYNETYVDRLCDRLFDYIENVVTSADEEMAQKNAINSWREMLERLNDPKVREKLLLYQTTNDYANIYGHVLKPSNVRDILDQMPTASFVAQRHVWKDIWHRALTTI